MIAAMRDVQREFLVDALPLEPFFERPFRVDDEFAMKIVAARHGCIRLRDDVGGPVLAEAGEVVSPDAFVVGQDQLDVDAVTGCLRNRCPLQEPAREPLERRRANPQFCLSVEKVYFHPEYTTCVHEACWST